MSRLRVTEDKEWTESAEVLLKQFKEREEVITNLVKVIANSTPVLGAYVTVQRTLGLCSLESKDYQRIGLAVAEACKSEYCLATHTAYARVLGMTADEIRDSRNASSINPKIDTALKFCQSVIDRKGHVTNREIEELRRAEISDKQIVEIIALASLSLFSCMLANVAQVPRGFREAEPNPGNSHK
ncbi:MAG: carboxymuconolactone decarboxylase family protein [Candidatus Zixiibacteriota bacterium]